MLVKVVWGRGEGVGRQGGGGGGRGKREEGRGEENSIQAPPNPHSLPAAHSLHIPAVIQKGACINPELAGES